MDFKQMLKSWAVIALGVLIASHTASGIHYETREALIIAVIVLSVCNVFIKPLLMLFSLPFIILTFGIGIWVINALLFLLVGSIVSGFHVDGFVSALWGAFVVSIIGGFAALFFSSSKQGSRINVNIRRGNASYNADSQFSRSNTSHRPKPMIKDDDDVIDI
jgi:putative membrane protein